MTGLRDVVTELTWLYLVRRAARRSSRPGLGPAFSERQPQSEATAD
jgi:hypothetical protein